MTTEAIVIERTFNAPVARVWKALTDVDQMRVWYFDTKEFKPEVGFEFGFVVEHKGNTYDHRCRITKVTRKRKSPIPGDTKDTKGTRWLRLNCFPKAKRPD